MKASKLWLLATVALSVMWLGCPSVTTMGSARTLQKGKFQGFVAPGVYGATSSGTTAMAPQIEGGFRYGITDKVEVGAKLWLVGFDVEGKFALLRPDSPDNGLNLSIAPGLGYLAVGGNSGTGTGSTGTASAGVLNVYVPILLGFRFAGHELTLGPKLIDTLVFGSSSSGTTSSSSMANILSAGASIGFALKVADGFRILPEFSVLYPVFGASSAGSNSPLGGGVIFQGGLGFLFGGAEEARPPDPTEEWAPPPPPPPAPAPTTP